MTGPQVASVPGIDAWWIVGDSLQHVAVGEVPGLLERSDGFVWVDVPVWDDPAERVLRETFRFHPQAIKDCSERTIVPKIQAYPDHLFVLLHAPHQGVPGRVHLLELDLFVAAGYLVTVHGPLGPGVPLEPALRETRAMVERIEVGRFHPTSPLVMAHALVSAIARRQERFVSDLAHQCAKLEQRVMHAEVRDPEAVLLDMFLSRHELLTVRTMAASAREVCGRMAGLAPHLPGEGVALAEDLLDQFDRVRSIADSERDFLQGVIDFYESRTTTKMNIAMERLALIAAVMLPVTALGGIFGMNFISQDAISTVPLASSLAVMALISAVMLVWARRKGWW